MSDWTTVWSELRRNLQDQPPCPEHPEYPYVRTLVTRVINDVIHVGEDGIIVRSHRKLNERFITEKIFRTWWQYLEQYGLTSLKPGADNNPRSSHSCIVGAIMGTCLPNRIKIVNKNLIEFVNQWHQLLYLHKGKYLIAPPNLPPTFTPTNLAYIGDEYEQELPKLPLNCSLFTP